MARAAVVGVVREGWLLMVLIMTLIAVVRAQDPVTQQEEPVEMVSALEIDEGQLYPHLYGPPSAGAALTPFDLWVARHQGQEVEPRLLMEVYGTADLTAIDRMEHDHEAQFAHDFGFDVENEQEGESEAEADGDAEVAGEMDAEMQTQQQFEERMDALGESESEGESESDLEQALEDTLLEGNAMVETSAEVDPKKIHVHVNTKLHGSEASENLLRLEDEFDARHDRLMRKLQKLQGRVLGHPSTIADTDKTGDTEYTLKTEDTYVK